MVKEIEVKSIMTVNKRPSGWFGVKYSLNIYRGCQHGCIYCDSRSECYKIENFDDIIVKINAPELLRKQISKKRKRATIGTGSMSDAYIPIEKEYKLTRKAVEIIAEFKFPFHTTTKSNLVLRDIDLLQDISRTYASVAFTLTTVDDELAKKIEPYAPLPSERLKAMGILSTLGIETGVTMMPILPYIEDNEQNIYNIVKFSALSGAKFIYPSFGMTLRDRQREYYYKKLDENFGGLKEKYQKRFKNRYGCGVNRYKRLKEVFYEACQKYNISLDLHTYEGKISKMQLSIFDIGKDKK